jgi:hypothetical protein
VSAVCLLGLTTAIIFVIFALGIANCSTDLIGISRGLTKRGAFIAVSVIIEPTRAAFAKKKPLLKTSGNTSIILHAFSSSHSKVSRKERSGWLKHMRLPILPSYSRKACETRLIWFSETIFANLIAFFERG